MKKLIGGLVVVLIALLTWFVMSHGPDTPAEYVAEYGGLESQYETLLTSTDCRYLGETAAGMDARYGRERDRVALGYQTAAVDRMVAIDCP